MGKPLEPILSCDYTRSFVTPVCRKKPMCRVLTSYSSYSSFLRLVFFLFVMRPVRDIVSILLRSHTLNAGSRLLAVLWVSRFLGHTVRKYLASKVSNFYFQRYVVLFKLALCSISLRPCVMSIRSLVYELLIKFLALPSFHYKNFHVNVRTLNINIRCC